MIRTLALSALAFMPGCSEEQAMIREAGAELDAAYARAEELGVPLTWDQVSGPKPPDSENILAELTPLLEAWSDGRSELVPPGGGLDGPRPTALARHDDEGLAGIEEILARPRAWAKQGSAAIGTNSRLKEAAKALAWRMRDRARLGDFEGAAEDLRSIRRLAWTAGQTPSLVAGLIALAIDQIGLGALPVAAEEAKGDSAALARLRQAVLASRPGLLIRQALPGEAMGAIDLARNLDRNGGLKDIRDTLNEEEAADLPQAPTTPHLQNGKPTDLDSRAALTRVLQVWNPVWADPVQDNAAVASLIHDSLQKVKSRMNDPAALVLDLFDLDYRLAGQAYLKGEAWHELAVAGMRVMEHRARTGALPHSLAEAGAAETFRGAPIRFAVQGKAFCVWTDGPDGRNQGPHFGPIPDPRPDDVVLCWPS